ncbi:MAG: nucleotidyl transferase AbiEii/AbiGii toxin family protein [Thermodesulfobacteriota bacterium]
MFENLLKKVARELKKTSVPYMVIGGQAVLLYGEPRLTRDIDITLGVGVEGLNKVREIVRRAGLKILVKKDREFVEKNMVLPTLDRKSGIRVDFIFSFSLYEKQAIERGKDIQLGRTTVRFASLEDLVIHKVIAGRARDLEDVKSVLLKNPKFDTDLDTLKAAEETFRGLVTDYATAWSLPDPLRMFAISHLGVQVAAQMG